MNEIHNARAEQIARDLQELADDANKEAAAARSRGDYSTAESLDRAAESLRCAMLIVNARGMG